MTSGWRRKTGSCVFLQAVLLLVFACSGKQTIREDPPRAAAAEVMLFLSAVQGNPVCMVVDIEKRRASSLFRSSRTKWWLNAWMVTPGNSTYLCRKKGKSKKGAMAPLHYKNKKLAFTTDKDEFLFYVPYDIGKFLLFTDPVFADRVRSGEEEEIRYGRMPARLFWNNRTVEGNLFYARWAWIDPPPKARKGPFRGLEPGGRLFAVWGPQGEFLYLEKGGEGGWEGETRFAVMQDRRGRWQETYQARWVEPECAFSDMPCEGESQRFRLQIPAWEVDGYLERLEAVLISMDGTGGEEDSSAAEVSPTEDTFWKSLQDVPQAKGQSPVEFCLLKGSIRVERDQRAVYGIGLLTKKP